MDPFKPLNSVTKATFNQCSTYMRSANRPACLLETFNYRRRREKARSELKIQAVAQHHTAVPQSWLAE